MVDTIMVGVDGSTGAVHALRWAAHMAHRNDGTNLDVVHAFHLTASYPALTEETESFPFSAHRDNERVASQRVLDSAITAVGDELAGLEVHAHIEGGAPAIVLPQLVGPTNLLVMGASTVHGHHHGHHSTVDRVIDAMGDAARARVVIVPHSGSDAFLGYPSRRVVALVPTAEAAHRVHTTLTERGVRAEHIEVLAGEEGAHSLDAEGGEHGPLRHLVRWVEHFGFEHDVAAAHQRGLLEGHFLFRVLVADEEEKDLVRDVLADDDGYDATYFGRWGIEKLFE